MTACPTDGRSGSASWNLLDDAWTLQPLDSTDRWQDADDDGMTNWEEYNVISPLL